MPIRHYRLKTPTINTYFSTFQIRQKLKSFDAVTFLDDLAGLGVDVKTLDLMMDDLNLEHHSAVHPECTGLGRGKCIHRMKQCDAAKILSNPSGKIPADTLSKLKKIAGRKQSDKTPLTANATKKTAWSKPELKTGEGLLAGQEPQQYLESKSGTYTIRSYLNDAETQITGRHSTDGATTLHLDATDEKEAQKRLKQVQDALQESLDSGVAEDIKNAPPESPLARAGKEINFLIGGEQSDGDWLGKGNRTTAAGSIPGDSLATTSSNHEIYINPRFLRDPVGFIDGNGSIYDNPVAETLTHEIGHLLTPGLQIEVKDGKTTKVAPGIPDLRHIQGQSDYGQSDPAEALAETYLRYRHSPELQLPVEAVMVAKQYGWSPRKDTVKSLVMETKTSSNNDGAQSYRCAWGNPNNDGWLKFVAERIARQQHSPNRNLKTVPEEDKK